MKPSFTELRQALHSRNIQLSHHRLKVLEYLTENRNHPTVDQIYIDLQQEIPTLSKTTIYNTLRMMLDAGLVRALTIEGNEIRYDIVAEDHGHFRCNLCREIYNFSFDTDLLVYDDLQGFDIHNQNVYFSGVCARCQSNIEENK